MANKIEELKKLKDYAAQLKKQYDYFGNEFFSDVAEYLDPYNDDITEDGRLPKGRRRGKKIFDPNPTLALIEFVDGITGRMFNPSTLWLKPRLPRHLRHLKAYPEVRQYLEDKSECVFHALAQSNFYQTMRSVVAGWGSFGTATMNVDEDKLEGKICFNKLHIRQTIIAENHYRKVDVLQYPLKMSARNMKRKFGEENLSETVKGYLKSGNEFQEVDVVNVVYPNDEFNAKLIGNQFKRFASKWYEKSSTDKFLRESGYDIFPYPTARYMLADGTPYGDSPATPCMPAIIGLQQIAKSLYASGDRLQNPGYNVPVEMRSKVKLRGFNYYDHHERTISPITTGINFPYGREWQQYVIDTVERFFFVPFFLSMQRAEKAMTALEVSARMGEQAAGLSPKIGDLMIFTDHVMDIVDDIETRAGRMPRIPDILLEYVPSGKLNYEYSGPLAQAQQYLFETKGVSDAMEALYPILQIRPETMDNFDWDFVARKIASTRGYPEDGYVDNDTLDSIREGRSAQESEALRKLDMDKLADILKKLGMADKQFQGKITPLLIGQLEGALAQPGVMS